MKKAHTRILALLLSMVMARSLLAGCGGNPSTPSNPSDSTSSDSQGTAANPANDPLLNNEETINLTVFSQTANWSGAQSGWAATLLKDKFNVELTIIPDVNGAYQTRMESGNLGDIVVWGNTTDDYTGAVNKGLLFDWEDEDLLGTYGTYIQETFPDAIAANKAINADGKVYGVANNLTNVEGDHNTFIYEWGVRWDLYEQLGHPEVKTLDDLANVLGQMKEICPTGDDGKTAYGIWPDWDGDMVMYVKSTASAFYGYEGDFPGLGLYDSATGEFYDCLAEGGPYMECLKFYNKLFRMGLVDPDSMTQTYDQMMPKMKNGNCLFSLQDWAGSGLYNTADHLADTEDKVGSIMLPLVPEDAKPIVYGLSTGGDNRVWSIGNNTMYPEKCMQIINWLHTPEGAMTIWYGIKGLMWDYNADGTMYFTELGQNCANDPSYDLTGVEWTSPETGNTYTLDGTFNDGMIQINNTTWAQGAINPEGNGTERFLKNTWASQVTDPRNAAEADWREFTGGVNNQQYMETTNYTVYPTISEYSMPEKDAELNLKWDQVKVAVVNGTWNAIYAKDDATFDSVVSQMRTDAEAYGYQDCVDWCKEQAQIRFGMQ